MPPCWPHASHSVATAVLAAEWTIFWPELPPELPLRAEGVNIASHQLAVKLRSSRVGHWRSARPFLRMSSGQLAGSLAHGAFDTQRRGKLELLARRPSGDALLKKDGKAPAGQVSGPERARKHLHLASHISKG